MSQEVSNDEAHIDMQTPSTRPNSEVAPASSTDGPSSQDPPAAPVMAPAPKPREHTADELIDLMNKTPLFMTSLDDADVENNESLQALKALAYEGTRAEVATNFKEQGNEAARMRQWSDAREFYNKAISALKMTHTELRAAQASDPIEEAKGIEKGVRNLELGDDERIEEVDEEEEERTEKLLLETCHVNRALCNLEMKNYRACNLDCATTLNINARNIKAYFRSASACLALDKLDEASDSTTRGLTIDPENASLQSLHSRISARATHLADLENQRAARRAHDERVESTLLSALYARGVRSGTGILKSKRTDAQPELEDASCHLVDPLDAHSELSFPVLLMYPLAAQTDFVKKFSERHDVRSHLNYILPPPWDVEDTPLYQTPSAVECFVESIAGTLLKVGKNVVFGTLLATGKVEFVDGLIRVYVVPVDSVAAWIEEFRDRQKWNAKRDKRKSLILS